MTYRVTNSMMQSLLLNDMHANLGKLLDIQQQLSTQRKYQYASQNPHAVTKGMGLETMMSETEKYITNLQDAVSWLKFTDDALGDMNDLFVRIRELAVKGGDGALEGVDRVAIAEELRQIKEALMSIANSTMNGESLFAGLKTDTTPFSIGANGDVQYSGNNYALLWEFARQLTGKVSITGREVFPQDEVTNRLKGIEVPLDFEWTGRGEILEFNVGSTTVKVRIPEKWTDEIANGQTDSSDYNRYRDPGEPLEGWTLDDIANMINSSKEMGDVSKTLKATVVKDLDRGVQYLQIQSHTGAPVRLTGWPETDPIKVASGIKGAAYGAVGRTAAADGRIDVRFGDNQVYTVDVEQGETLAEIADKINTQPDGRIWASYKSDGTNEWIDFVAKNPDDYFNIETTGGATQIFAPEMATAVSAKDASSNQVVSSKIFDTTLPFESVSDGVITIRQGQYTYRVPVTGVLGASATQATISAAVNAAMNHYKTDPSDPNYNPALDITASVSGGALVLSSPGDEFSVTAEGGLAPLFSDGVSLSSNYKPDSDGKYSMDTGVIPSGFVLDTTHPFAFEFEYEGAKYWIDSGDLTIASPPTLENIAIALENKLQTIDPNIEVTWDKKLDEDGNEIQWLHAETTSGPFSLSGFGGAADVIGAFTFGSEEIYENFDHTHIGFAAMMQMETALSSTEISVVPPQVWDTTAPGNAVHLNFASGTHHAEVFIADEANLTLDQLAARINSVCGDWLEAVVETDYPDGVNPIIDPLNNSGDNKENATQRLVLRTKTGEPLAVYDGLGKTGAPAGAYAETLGINTALGIQNIDLWQQPGDMPLLPPTDPDYVGYPTDGDGFFDENMPAILNVTVGDRTYQVKVCKNNRYNGKLVAEAIRDQVNEQYGGTLIALGKNVSPSGDPKDDVYSVYAVTGEPLRVVDAPYGDPRFTEFTGGIASQLGIASGLASMTAMSDTDTFGPGVIRISTPGHSIDVPVLAGETLHDIANRIRDYAGGWLDVSFFDSNMNASGGKVALTLAAKDGSAVSVFDAKGDVAWNMGMDTGLVGTADLATFPALSADSTITISVNGASHTIDLWDSDFVNSNGTTGKAVVSSVEELADLINTRFQGQDIRAEVISETLSNGSVLKRLALWSPKGYNFEITGTPAGSIPDDFGFTPGINAASNVHGNAGTPFNQVVTHRTGNNQYNVDFFGVMDNLVNTVEGGDVDGISDTMLSQLDSWLSTLLQCRSKAGALTNRYDTAVYRMQSNNTNYTDLYTQTVGIDLAEAFTEYETASAVYEASLAAIAKLLQPTLLDFLR